MIYQNLLYNEMKSPDVYFVLAPVDPDDPFESEIMLDSSSWVSSWQHQAEIAGMARYKGAQWRGLPLVSIYTPRARHFPAEDNYWSYKKEGWRVYHSCAESYGEPDLFHGFPPWPDGGFERFEEAIDFALKEAEYIGWIKDKQKAIQDAIDAAQAWNPNLFQIGQEVIHPKFGKGRVVESTAPQNEEIIRVDFDEHGVKNLSVSVARLNRI